jgi:hypothetical protein
MSAVSTTSISTPGRRTAIVDAVAAGDLGAAKANLEQAAVLAEPAKDDAAAGIRAYTALLNGTDIGAVEAALNAMNSVPQSVLFQDLYLAIWTPLFYPDFPDRQAAPGAEWVQVNAATPDGPIEQYWGTVTWSLPADAAVNGFDAAASVPDIGLAGTLALTDGDTMALSFASNALFGGATITNAIGFWTTNDDSESLLSGTITSIADGVVIMTLSAGARADNLDRLRTANEIGLAIDYETGQRVIIRFQLGDTGRAVIAEAYPASPAN